MKRLVILLLACSAVALCFSALASAQGARGVPTIALHIDATKKADRCIPVTAGLEDNADCDLISVAAENESYLVYVLAGSHGLTGISGMELSINYDPGITVHAWSRCSLLDFPGATWPATGADNTITWGQGDDCSENDLNIGGYFEMTAYEAGKMWVGPRSASGVMQVTNCSLVTTTLNSTEDAGIVAFGGGEGCNPCTTACEGVATEAATWGRIKNLYMGG